MNSGLPGRSILIAPWVWLSNPSWSMVSSTFRVHLDRVYAVDAASGRLLWKFDPKVSLTAMRNSWAARTNRGVAVWEGMVYVGTGDCRMIALNASTGEQRWQSPVCVDTTQTGITGAPHVADGKVFIGYNGSDSGVRGSIVAFDADTGELAMAILAYPG